MDISELRVKSIHNTIVKIFTILWWAKVYSGENYTYAYRDALEALPDGSTLSDAYTAIDNVFQSSAEEMKVNHIHKYADQKKQYTNLTKLMIRFGYLPTPAKRLVAEKNRSDREDIVNQLSFIREFADTSYLVGHQKKDWLRCIAGCSELCDDILAHRDSIIENPSSLYDMSAIYVDEQAKMGKLKATMLILMGGLSENFKGSKWHWAGKSGITFNNWKDYAWANRLGKEQDK